MEVIRKKSHDGEHDIVVAIETSRYGHVNSVAYLDGKQVGSHSGPHHRSNGAPPEYPAAVGSVAFTADEAAKLEAAWAQAKAELPRDLHEERRQLVIAVNATNAGLIEDPALNFEDEDDPYPYRNVPAMERELAERRQALADFDTQHPQIREQVIQEREERYRRNREAGL